MRVVLVVLLVFWIGAASVRPAAAQQPPGPGPVPASSAESAQVSALIAQLGNADFHARRDATSRLRQIGPAALPQLKEAATSTVPEIRARASVLVRQLEHHPVPGRPRVHARTSSANYSIINGRQVINIDDAGRKIHITQGDDGIQMTVAGEVDGQPATETYKASTAEDLRSDNPEAFALYDRIVRRFGLDLELHGIANPMMLRGNVIIVPPQQFRPFIATGGDDLRTLRSRLDTEMDKAALSAQQRQRVADAVDRIENARQVGNAGVNDQDKQIESYDRACDDLRKVAADLKLPDPGDALPPPKSARLGVSVLPDDGISEGIVVAHVVAQSRAERVGLQEDDVIRKINGKPVRGVADLREQVTQRPRGLVIDIVRDGREMRLEEK